MYYFGKTIICKFLGTEHGTLLGMTWCRNLIFLCQIFSYANALLAHVSNHFQNCTYKTRVTKDFGTCRFTLRKMKTIGQYGELTYFLFYESFPILWNLSFY
jgi:hypothetical protein